MASLTAEEEQNVRTALRFLRQRFEKISLLAKALHYNPGNMYKLLGGRYPVSPGMAFKVARLAQVGVDDVLTGRYPAVGACPHCGRGPG